MILALKLQAISYLSAMKYSNVLHTIEIPQFIQRVKMSNKRRAQYYTRSTPIPKKYQDSSFVFDRKGRLCTEDMTPIIRNSRSVNTPRFKTINGQEFYAGLAKPVIRVKIVNAIKDSFRPYVQPLPKLKQFPVQFFCEYHDVPGKADWDLDNKWIYLKVFQDLLVNEGKMPDDNIKYVSRAASMEYVPVESEEDRKLVFYICSDARKHQFFYP